MFDKIPNRVFRNALEETLISTKVSEERLRLFGHARWRETSAPVRRVDSLLVVGGGGGETDRGDVVRVAEIRFEDFEPISDHDC
ncbi:hypothetical protein OROGR_016243 [Orobanche gracilis]